MVTVSIPNACFILTLIEEEQLSFTTEFLWIFCFHDIWQVAIVKPDSSNIGQSSVISQGIDGIPNQLECAKRELFEETGISSDNFVEIGKYVSDNTIYYNFLCVTNCNKSNIKIQRDY